jgi:hypothetical protein
MPRSLLPDQPFFPPNDSPLYKMKLTGIIIINDIPDRFILHQNVLDSLPKSGAQPATPW